MPGQIRNSSQTRIRHSASFPDSRVRTRPRSPVFNRSDVEARISSALDHCKTALERVGARSALARLTTELAEIRSATERHAWYSAARECRLHPVNVRLREDPFTREAFEKPRGFAGDANMLDFVYQHRTAERSSVLGRELLEVTTGVPIAQAVRGRCAHIAHVVRQVLQTEPGATVASIACGHMRELHLIPPEIASHAKMIALDQDTLALQQLASLHPYFPVQPVAAHIRSLLTNQIQLSQPQLIYASGLYDYLDTVTAIALTRALLQQLPGEGRLLIANLSPVNEEAGFMEAVMDWWMVYRNIDDMATLAATSVAGSDARIEQIYAIHSDRITCAMIRKM